MIRITRQNSSVVLKLGSIIQGAGEWTYTFSWNASGDDYAQLLVNQFNESLENRLKKIREDSYEQGWKDAKAKTRKQTWFGGYF